MWLTAHLPPHFLAQSLTFQSLVLTGLYKDIHAVSLGYEISVCVQKRILVHVSITIDSLFSSH